MKRVCIFPIFDKDGIFDESVLFFIRSLKEVVERLIIVVIGFITNDSLLFLKKYTNEILIKVGLTREQSNIALKIIFLLMN